MLKKVDKMTYELAKKYVYTWSEINLAKLNMQDAIEVDGDSQTVTCYTFRGLFEVGQ